MGLKTELLDSEVSVFARFFNNNYKKSNSWLNIVGFFYVKFIFPLPDNFIKVILSEGHLINLDRTL